MLTGKMTPHDAWLYAASWGSLTRSGDPGACMYGFNEHFRVQSERHRADCLRWIEEHCRPMVISHPGCYDENELDNMDAFVATLKAAPAEHI